MATFKVLRHSNFDDPSVPEVFVTGLPSGMTQVSASLIADCLNDVCYRIAENNHTYHYRVVPSDYVLNDGDPNS